MNQLIPELEKRKEYLECLRAFINQQLKTVPPGKLRISKNRGVPRYFQVTEVKDTTGRYLTKENHELARKLAEKDYLNKLIKVVESELHDINNYLNNQTITNLEDIYTFTNDYRKHLFNPLILPDDLYVQQWENESYESNPYYENDKIYPTKKGDLARTKSEVLLADMYYELGIPYRYEAQVRLKNGDQKYPDFTLLDVKNRKLVYHEHLGLLDDGDYRWKNLRKLNEYRRNGIYPGKNLIITYEAEGSPLNINEIRQMITEMDLLGRELDTPNKGVHKSPNSTAIRGVRTSNETY